MATWEHIAWECSGRRREIEKPKNRMQRRFGWPMTGEEEYDKKIIRHVEETVRRTWEERHGEDRARRWTEERKASARLTDALYGKKQETEQEKAQREGKERREREEIKQKKENEEKGAQQRGKEGKGKGKKKGGKEEEDGGEKGGRKEGKKFRKLSDCTDDRRRERASVQTLGVVQALPLLLPRGSAGGERVWRRV